MKPFYSNQKHADLLLERAKAWAGTPFVPNSQTPGEKGGVSCQYLCHALYNESGFVMDAEPAPMNHARFSKTESLVVNYMKHKQAGRFTEVDPGLDPLVGDLLGFRIGNVVHHTGVALGGGNFMHSAEKIGACICSLRDGTYIGRLFKVWRPME